MRDGDEESAEPGRTGKLPRLGYFLTEEVVNKCRLTIDDVQHRALFEIMMDTGLNWYDIVGDEGHETRGIHIQEVDSRGLNLKIHTRSKQGTMASRTIPVHIETIVAIKNLLASIHMTLHDNGKLFDLKERRVRQYLEELSAELNLPEESKITPLVLRRTAIVRMLQSGVKPDEVRRRLGFIRPVEDIIICTAGYFIVKPEAYERMVRMSIIKELDLRD